MKILQIHDYPPFQSGGIELNVSGVSNELVRRGYKTTLAVGRFDKDIPMDEKEYNQTISRDGLQIIFLDSPQTIERLISESDIVHIHFTFSCRPASFIALESAVKKKKPTVVSIRTNYAHIPFSALNDMSILEKKERLQKVKEYFSAQNVTLVGLSRSTKETLEKLGIKKKLNIIRNGLAEPISNYSGEEERIIDPVDITYIGRMCTLKGIHYLLDAFRMLVRENPKVTMRLVGDGPEMKQYLQLIKHFDLSRNIFLTGHIENKYVPYYINATKVVVHPSFTETWCNAIAETLSYGVPVIASDIEGIKELTQKGKFADLVPVADTLALYSNMKEILTNRERYIGIKEKADLGKNYVRKNYTLEKQSQSLINLYKKILYGQTK